MKNNTKARVSDISKQGRGVARISMSLTENLLNDLDGMVEETVH